MRCCMCDEKIPPALDVNQRAWWIATTRITGYYIRACSWVCEIRWRKRSGVAVIDMHGFDESAFMVLS